MAETVTTSTSDPKIAEYLKEIADHLANIEKTVCANAQNDTILKVATNLFQNNYCVDGKEKSSAKRAISKASTFYKILKEYGLVESN